MECLSLQGLAKRLSPVLVYFVPALAYHFCLAFPEAFAITGDHFFPRPVTLLCRFCVTDNIGLDIADDEPSVSKRDEATQLARERFGQK